MKYFLCYICIACGACFSIVAAQNLIPNPSFEKYDDCPKDIFEPLYASYWNKLSGVPKYLATCNNYPQNLRDIWWDSLSQPHHGENQILMRPMTTLGFLPPQPVGYVDYIYADLMSTLEKDREYYFSSYYRANLNAGRGNNLGVYFYSSQPLPPVNMPYLDLVPHIVQKTHPPDFHWQKLDGCYSATGNEKGILIGGFYEGVNEYSVQYFDNISDTVHYDGSYAIFLDDISLRKIPVLKDTIVCSDSTINLKKYSRGIDFEVWESGVKIEEEEIVIRGGDKTLIFRLPCCDIEQEVVVQALDCNEMTVFLPNAFSPNADNLNDQWGPFFSKPAYRDLEVKVFDRWGNLIYDKAGADVNDIIWDGTSNADMLVPAGVYVYVLKYYDFILQKEVIKTGDVTIFR